MSTTHFGFRTVEEAEKASHVKGVFDSVAAKYDVMNNLMSVGLHRLWKTFTIAMPSTPLQIPTIPMFFIFLPS